jgi:uncharacterized membrane protein/mono/diheme cytochrome c family protein
VSVADFAIAGRLHPLVLHFPIGLLFGAVLMEVLVAREQVTRRAQSLLLWCTAASAVLAAASGWVLSHEEGYGGDLVELHERLGIAVAVLSVLAALAHRSLARSGSPVALRAYRSLLGIACVVVVPAGHVGSKLTHGEDWLEGPRERVEVERGPAPVAALAEGLGTSDASTSEAVPAPVSEDVPAPAPVADVAPASSATDAYAETIAPLFAERCKTCHGPTKKKGGLRLDTREGLLAGGEDGPVLVPGDPAASLLFQRVSLPLEHEDHMPPEGKPQPTQEELAALEAWIAAGAPFGAASAAEAEKEEASAPASQEKEEEEEAASPPPPAKPAGPPSDALGALDRALIHHERVDPELEELRIDVAAVAPSFGDAEARALLVPLAPWTAELVLARSAVGDATLAELARFPALRRLDLRATRVSAAGLAALAGHAALEELNLAQTKLGDGAVDVLLDMPRLRRVDLWSAGLSPEALARLRAAPALRVEAGDEPEAAVLEAEGELTFTSDRAQPGAELVPDALRPVNATCPVSGSPVNTKYALVHTSAAGTRVIGFCCPNCPKEFWADPAKFESKLP